MKIGHFAAGVGRLFAVGLLAALIASPARAVPAYARQTGQNCVACHVGGQFPELTSYGRTFKLTGYTMGARTVPISAMAVLGYTKTADKTNGGVDPAAFRRDGSGTLQSASVFLAGKVFDNLGVFSQWTYNPYSGDDGMTGHSTVDNTELRFADRLVDAHSDLIYGAFINNNPSLQDVWNSSSAWGYPYVQSAFGQLPGPSPLLAGGLAQGTVGGGAYLQWNQMVYGELSLYKTADGMFSFLRAGPLGNRFSNPAPYWRLALSHDWGAHNLMVGTNGISAKLHNDPNDPNSSVNKFVDTGFDAQYQYILDPQAISVHLSYLHEKQTWGSDQVAAGVNPSNTLKQFKLKAAYTYDAKYSASLAYQRGRGSNDAALYPAGDPLAGSANNSPNYSVWVPEIAWTPIQYVRVGLQYWRYGEFAGAGSNYSGLGRNAKDNNMAFLYVWLVR